MKQVRITLELLGTDQSIYRNVYVGKPIGEICDDMLETLLDDYDNEFDNHDCHTGPGSGCPACQDKWEIEQDMRYDEIKEEKLKMKAQEAMADDMERGEEV